MESGQLGNSRYARTDQYLQVPKLYTGIFFAQCLSPEYLCGGLGSLVLHVGLLALFESLRAVEELPISTISLRPPIPNPLNQLETFRGPKIEI